jgi:CRISPR system Cascade subunit CasB
MSIDGRDLVAPYFYRLAAKHDLVGRPEREKRWARIVQLMAILTEKGRDEDKRSPHTPATTDNHWRRLGTALCDGGDASWPPTGETPRPMLSEDRLARLLAAKGEMRASLLERAVRMLAARKPAGAGVNCTDIARFLLQPDEQGPVSDIARAYYRRFDAALRRADGDEDIDRQNSASGDHA